MKISPISYKFHYVNKQSVSNNKQSNLPSFNASTSPVAEPLGSPFPMLFAPIEVNTNAHAWIKDTSLSRAIDELESLSFDEKDVKHVQSLGAFLPFQSGKEAVDFINSSNVRIKFDALPSVNVHAQYDYEDNFIKINEIYKNTQNPAEILAIAEAILHEAGHAKDKDFGNSLQEEINCLSLNALSHRAFLKKYPEAFKNADSLIIKDGVCVYAELFFDDDSSHQRLVDRLKQKYDFLPAGDFTHPPGALALRVKTS